MLPSSIMALRAGTRQTAQPIGYAPRAEKLAEDETRALASLARVRAKEAEADERKAALVIALARTGLHDADALHDVYQMTHVKLQAVCLTVCFDYQDAQDALQDCYIAVWRTAALYDATRASPITWLARIARNKAIDRLRKRRIETPPGRSVVEDNIPDTALNPEESAIANQRRAFANASVNDLRVEQAALVRAIYMEGLTYRQLSARSGLPIPTVKSKVQPALSGMRAQFEGRI